MVLVCCPECKYEWNSVSKQLVLKCSACGTRFQDGRAVKRNGKKKEGQSFGVTRWGGFTKGEGESFGVEKWGGWK
jgi:hypothetical protein